VGVGAGRGALSHRVGKIAPSIQVIFPEPASGFVPPGNAAKISSRVGSPGRTHRPEFSKRVSVTVCDYSAAPSVLKVELHTT